jgi:hypothetical protein
MHLAGVALRDEAVLELARLVDNDALSARLETAYGRMTKVLALTIPEREAIIRALDNPPAGWRNYAPCCSVSTSGACATGWSEGSKGVQQRGTARGAVAAGETISRRSGEVTAPRLCALRLS